MTEASSPKNHLAQIARLAENPVLRLARELRSDPFFDLKKRMDDALRGMRVFEQQRSAIAGFLEQAESIRNIQPGIRTRIVARSARIKDRFGIKISNSPGPIL